MHGRWLPTLAYLAVDQARMCVYYCQIATKLVKVEGKIEDFLYYQVVISIMYDIGLAL